MKKTTYIFLYLCFILCSKQGYTQTTHYLPDGKIIFEDENSNLTNVTAVDSLKIIKDVVLIRYDSGTTADAINYLEENYVLNRRHACLTGWMLYDVPDTSNILGLADSLMNREEISNFEFSYRIPLLSSATLSSPDDPEYGNQWYLNGEFGIHAPEAWEITTGNSSLQVAVLDNGIGWSNPDLVPNTLGWDYTTNPPNPDVGPDNCNEWHGTMVSSIIASKTNNSYGISGIAGGWSTDPATIVMCKVGSSGNMSTAAMTVAIDSAVQQGIRLFNFSWGSEMASGNCFSEAIYLNEEIDLAYSMYGAIMFAAAGNENSAQGVAWPACKSNVISVGATESDGTRWNGNGDDQEGSNFGPNTDISAPGADIYHPVLYYGEPQTYIPTSATSCATPMAVGVAALMLTVNPCLTNADVQYILQKTADQTGGYYYNWDASRPGHSQELGYGKINAYEAVIMASDQLTQIDANENAVFDEPKWFTHDLTLVCGSTLTITSTVKFTEDNKIIVEPGAQLIIDGGTLTSTCSGFWGGIEVRGNADMPQYPVSNQGYVQILNGGRIERANPGIHSANGGLVVATDAVFLNNRRSVAIENYPGWNHSIFTRCSFLLTDASGLTGNQYFIGAELVHPLRISGCTFRNIIPDEVMAFPDRGYGILSLDADIFVYSAPDNPMENEQDSIRPLFYKLAYGIYSMRSGTQSSIHITDTRFENNMRGAYVSGFNGTSFVYLMNSAFNIPNSTYLNAPPTYGLYLDHCSGYTIQQNEFYSENETSDGYGLIINESGPYDNEIYNNAFHNLRYGSQTQGCNRYSYPYVGGLCYRCNDFYDNRNDIFVISDAAPGVPNQGISLSQGNKIQAAKNTFTEENNAGYDIYNSIDVITYCLDQDDNGNNITPEPNVGVVNYIVQNSEYDKNLDCPYNTTGFIIDAEDALAELAESASQSDSLSGILSSLTDGGSTEDLVSEVTTSTPPEALEVREELLINSPYLSDSVMSAAIAQETVLPNAMIRDILVENPQSSKTDALIEALEYRVVPMPDSMMAQIMEGVSVLGAKEILEQEIFRWRSKYAITMKELIRYYHPDTAEMTTYDSLIDLVKSDGSLNSRYDLVSLYYGNGDVDSGNAVMSAIPATFALTGPQSQVHNMYVSLFPILHQIASDSTGLASLDSAQVVVLTAIAEGDSALPGIYARNMLIMSDAMQYEEPILIPSVLKEVKRYGTGSEDPSHNFTGDFRLKVFPNPAHHYFIVEYRAAKTVGYIQDLSISLTDILGHELIKLHLKHCFDQIIIPTETMPAGTYLINLSSGGKLREQAKVIIN